MVCLKVLCCDWVEAAQGFCVADVFIEGGNKLGSFKTISGESFAEFVEKRSRFLCYAKHIESHIEAEDYINFIKSKHWDAKHNVYAYRVHTGNLSKSSDDGEPQRTAGVPILNRLIGMEITDCVIVVTRYFGGVLLGTGGLARAYSHGAELVLESCEIVEMRSCVMVKLRVSYEIFNKAKKIVEQLGARFSGCTYTNFVESKVYVEREKIDAFVQAINRLSSGSAEIIVKNDEVFYM